MNWLKEKKKEINAVMMISAKADQTVKVKPMTSKFVLLVSFFNLRRANREKLPSDRNKDKVTQRFVIVKDSHFLGCRTKPKDKRSFLI